MPRRDDRPITGILSKTNFLTANAVDAILAVPRCPNQNEVNYLEKEDYGKIPKYLDQASYEKFSAGSVNHAMQMEGFNVIVFVGVNLGERVAPSGCMALCITGAPAV